MATTTPVLGLFKPVVGADDDDWGAFWNSNADTLDAALVGGGPFLPLTGGVVSGRTQFMQSDWLTPLSGWHGLTSNVYVLSPGSGTGLTGAAYSTTSGGAIGITGVGFNQTTTSNGGAWGGYFEARQYPGVPSYTMGAEINVANVSGVDAVFPGPYGFPPAPATIGINLQSGGQVSAETPPLTAKTASTGIWIGDNDARFHVGILFKATGLVGTDGAGTGTAPALSMSAGHALQWSMPGNVTGPMITSQQTTGTPAQLIFENTRLHLISGKLAADNGFDGPIGGGTPATGAFTGINFGSATASGTTNLSRHIDLHGGMRGFCVDSGGNLSVVAGESYNGMYIYTGGAMAGLFLSSGLEATPIGIQIPNTGTFTQIKTGGTTGPTWTSGTAAPSASEPVSSLYSRVGGALGQRLYVSGGGGVWTGVAGV